MALDPMAAMRPPGLEDFDISGHGGAAAAGHAVAREFGVRTDVADVIEAQMCRLIEQARQETEIKVKLELKSIRDAMIAMDQQLDGLLHQLEGPRPKPSVRGALDGDAFGKRLAEVEQHWGHELKAIRDEVQMAVASHNHNADLLAHHRDTISGMKEACTRLQQPIGRDTEILAQLKRLEERVEASRASRRGLEAPLSQRLAKLEQRADIAQATALQSIAGWRYHPAMGAAAAAAAAASGIPPGLPGAAPVLGSTAMPGRRC